MLVKNKKAIFKFGCAMHDGLIDASNLLIDETVNTVSKSQKIASKIIRNGEPIVAKQVEITIDTIADVKNLAVKGGKRALKLIGMTKEFNSLTKTISKKVDAMPTAEDLIDNAKDYVANAKSDVEKTITKATDSIKKVAATAEKTIEAKTAEITKTVKTTTSEKKSPAKKPTAAKKKIAKTVKPAAKKSVKTVTKKVAVNTVAKKVVAKKVVAKKVVAKKVVAKKVVAKKVVAIATKPAATVAPKKVVKAESTTDLTNIKGIGPSLANIMNANGIKNIAQLKEATPVALKIVATKAGNRYASFDTNLWVEAAKATK
ncbi:MAG: putative flap endonuclease-1-like 5' DNA nuclease [Halioglobus sp.]|jgi:predicted flap endonuclease-1-like 5' DNA nuclease